MQSHVTANIMARAYQQSKPRDPSKKGCGAKAVAAAPLNSVNRITVSHYKSSYKHEKESENEEKVGSINKTERCLFVAVSCLNRFCALKIQTKACQEQVEFDVHSRRTERNRKITK